MEGCSPMGLGRRPALRAVAVLILGLLLPAIGAAQSLRVSVASMDLQNQQAALHGFTFARTSNDVQRLIDSGALVPVRGNQYFEVKEGVTFPYARPEVRDFLLGQARYPAPAFAKIGQEAFGFGEGGVPFIQRIHWRGSVFANKCLGSGCCVSVRKIEFNSCQLSSRSV